jgi:hypothetical protein
VNVRTQDVIQYTNIMDRLTVQLFGTTNFLMKCGTVDTEAMPELGIRVDHPSDVNSPPDCAEVSDAANVAEVDRCASSHSARDDQVCLRRRGWPFGGPAVLLLCLCCRVSNNVCLTQNFSISSHIQSCW